MRHTFRTALFTGLSLLLVQGTACADEGMWTFDNLPMKQMKAKFGFEPSQAWLDHVRLSALRMSGGSASFVSADGLVLTNHHMGHGAIQQVSRDLNISHSVHALTLCSELTAYSQLSGFYIRHRDTAGREAALLSRARLLYAVLAPHRFGDRFFVPLAGVTDENGQSPFWDALGRKFFKMDFLDAERTIGGARNRTLIVELMPHYPVYVPLLPGPAQAAMGQIHPTGQMAFDLLTEEGFEADEYIDIFDGGPILQAHKHALRSFSGSTVKKVANAELQPPTRGGKAAMVNYAVASSERKFRAIVLPCDPVESSDAVCLPPAAREALGVTAGDSVICVRI